MNDREFIELLNLYVDREISAEDAVRLEAEVMADPRRREIYDQYCRLQKACRQLTEEEIASAPARSPADVILFPSSGPSFGAILGGLAAAAAVALVVVQARAPKASAVTASVAAPTSRPLDVGPARVAAPSDEMQPVFLLGRPQAAVRPAVFVADGQNQLNWIGDVRIAPVFPVGGSEIRLSPETELKAAALADPQGDRNDSQPAETTAFRFQR